jgi:hypothetical protein
MTDSPVPHAAPARGGSCLVKVLIAVALLALVLGGIWWWSNRPIQPVVLSAPEKAAVQAKVEAIQQPTESGASVEPKYEKGGKEIIITERELNGLLNERTSLGQTVSFELVTDAIHARVETDLNRDLPVVGGKRLKARARFLVSSEPGKASFVLDDVTVWGVSLPNDWLAGIKGRDLLGEILGGGKTGSIAGIKELKVQPGQLIIRLAE